MIFLNICTDISDSTHQEKEVTLTNQSSCVFLGRKSISEVSRDIVRYLEKNICVYVAHLFKFCVNCVL